jgi:hypothetical protein
VSAIVTELGFQVKQELSITEICLFFRQNARAPIPSAADVQLPDFFTGLSTETVYSREPVDQKNKKIHVFSASYKVNS